MPTLNFKGKNDVISYHLSVPYHDLPEDEKKSFNSKGWEGNQVIHGDSLIVLKSLIPHYANKIQCVYLDFPYNTGNEGWVYNDNLKSPTTKEWLDTEVVRDDLTRHDKWLCMVYPRLSLVKELMADSGIIILSIDDNEVSNLKLALDEIFGDENCIGILPTVMNLKGNQDEFGFAGTHEYTIVYVKDKEQAKFGEFDIDEDELEKWKEDDKGWHKKGAGLKMTGLKAPREVASDGLWFPIFLDKNGIPYVTDNNKPRNKEDKDTWPLTDGKEMSWRWNKDRVKKDIDEIIVSNEDGGISFYKRQKPTLGDIPSKKPKTTLYKPEYSSGNGTNQLKAIFGKKVFPYPKPLDLIKDLLSIATDSDSIVLDATGGSGVTGHAVLDLNHEDAGNRKFILIECEDKYANKITAERVRKIIKGVPGTKFSEGRKGEFCFRSLGNPMDPKALLYQDSMPSWDALARHIFWMATNKQISGTPQKNKNFYVGNSENIYVYLHYENKTKFMESEEAILKASQIYKIAEHAAKKFNKGDEKSNKIPNVIVYAAGAYMSASEMKKMKVTLARIPNALS